MKPFLTSLVVVFLGLALVSCGDSHTKTSPLKSVQQKTSESVAGTISSDQTSYYQFGDLVGNAPQMAFDPNYRPRSRARRAGATRESSGALLYTFQNNETYLLIGKERQNNFWNFMRGSVDIGDSYVLGAVHEINQETGGIYVASEDTLRNASFDVYTSTARNYACTFFVKVDYISAQDLLTAARNHPNPHFREMTQYSWIRLSDLNAALTHPTPMFSAQTITGTTETFHFYQYSFDILRQAHQKNILNNLN